ncbi:hypothetical protein DSO57_1019696 [Entomophthora muscae]|uniref:Uncharacterized protein n=1 Tax=Entomophthora muscae TaxID=34485 RepID=A0ACC2TRJ5_9FUNG|nr:hypothetical protein DSO57_1019696 [Entomophthora muscae]
MPEHLAPYLAGIFLEKIKKPFLQKHEESNNETPPSNREPTEVKPAEWVSIEDNLSSSLEAPAKKIVLTKDQISQIFYEQIRINHPDAKESSTAEDLLTLSIKDPKIKLKVLPSLEEALNEASSSKLYNYPNRNLNNSQTVQDVFAYYVLEEERVGAFAGFPLEQFFRKLKESSANDPTAALPPNLVFKPYVPKQRKHRDVIPGCKHIPKKVKTSMPKKGGDKRLPPRHLRNHL